MSEKQKLTLGRQSRKYLLLPVVIACAALLASCGGGSDSTSTAESIDGTKEALAVSGATGVPPGWTGRAPKMEVINGIIVPPEPAPSINNATLAGVDVNANGVRDDVERKIAIVAKSSIDFNKALNYLKAQQATLTLPLPQSRTEAINIIKMASCALTGSGTIPQNMKSRDLLANTPERQLKLQQFDDVAGGYFSSEVACQM